MTQILIYLCGCKINLTWYKSNNNNDNNNMQSHMACSKSRKNKQNWKVRCNRKICLQIGINQLIRWIVETNFWQQWHDVAEIEQKFKQTSKTLHKLLDENNDSDYKMTFKCKFAWYGKKVMIVWRETFVSRGLLNTMKSFRDIWN